MSIFEIIIPKENLNKLLEPCDNPNWGGYYALIVYPMLLSCLLLGIVYKIIIWIAKKIINNKKSFSETNLKLNTQQISKKISVDNTLKNKQNNEKTIAKNYKTKGIENFKLKKYDSAIKNLEQAILLQVEITQEMHCMLAFSYFVTYQGAKAYEHFNKIDFENYLPELKDLVMDLEKIKTIWDINTFYEKQEYEKAINCFEQNFKIEKAKLNLLSEYNLENAYHKIAFCYFCIGKYDKANELFKISYPNNFIQGLCYIKLKDKENALKALSNLKSPYQYTCREELKMFLNTITSDDINNLNDKTLNNILFEYIFKIGTYLILTYKEIALAFSSIIEKFSSCEYDFQKFYEPLGYAYLETRASKKAFEILLKSVELGANNHRTFFELGRFYLKKKNYNEALNYFNKAIEQVNDVSYYKDITLVKAEDEKNFLDLKDISSKQIKIIDLKYIDYYKARLYIDDEQYNKAEKYFSKVIDTENSPIPLNDIYVLRSFVCCQGNIGNPIKDLVSAIDDSNLKKTMNRICNLDYAALQEFINIYLSSKQYNIPRLQADIRYSEKDQEFLRVRGLLHFYLGNYNNAYSSLKSSLNNIDEDDESRKQLEEIDKKRNVKTKNKPADNKPSERQVYNDNKIINIQTCTTDDLRTLQGFSEEKAKLFIEKRNNGMMWYDIDSFAQDFELQPHEIIMLQDRLNFPIKPNVKLGRKIDI